MGQEITQHHRYISDINTSKLAFPVLSSESLDRYVCRNLVGLL